MSDIEVVETNLSEAEEPQVELVEVEAQEAYFLKDCVKVVLSDGIEKLVTYDTFGAILAKATNTLQDTKLSGLCTPFGTFFIAKNSSTIQLNVYYPGGIKPLKYDGKTFNIVVPNIIVAHVLTAKANDWEVASTKYFCTDVSISSLPREFINGINHPRRIWLLPMSNTYSSGNMCYGGNQMPRRFTEGNLRGLDWYYQYMWESSFNNDLGLSAVPNMRVDHWYALLKECAKDDKPFPYDKLHGFTAR